MESKILDKIYNSQSILLLTHENPDGDAVGSVLGLYHYLISINKSVDMVVVNVPKVYGILPSINKIVDTSDRNYDLGIVVDCSTKERIGNNALVDKCKNTINIDHHISNTNYGDLNYVYGDVSSCSQVIYYLLKKWNVNISFEIGNALMCGVLTDTNGFANNDVDENTFNMAADLCKIGIDIHKLYYNFLSKKTTSQYELMKIAMDRLEFINDKKIAFTYLFEDDFNQVNGQIGEHEGIVDIGRNIQGVEVSLFIRENNGWTFSLRSTGKIDVSQIAIALGGGGHKMAAGGKLNKTFEETKCLLIEEIEKVLN